MPVVSGAAQPALPPTVNKTAAEPATTGRRPATPQPQPLRPKPVERSGNTVIRAKTDEELGIEEDLGQRALRASTPMLVSAIVHMFLLIIFGLWAFSEAHKIDIELVASVDGPEDVLDVSSTASSFDTATQLEAAPLMTTLATSDPFSSVTPPPVDPFGTVAARVTADGPLGNRSEAGQEYAVNKRGGSRASQSAVGNGLRWLADRQDKTRGYWRLQGYDRKDNVELVINENPIAATAMALLAFQGAGHTHQSGRYASNVEKGLKYLLSNQTSDGNFCPDSARISRDERLYSHAQCTIVICELLAMTRDEKLRQTAERAVEYCIKAQDLDENRGGGWRYQFAHDSDTSVTGWMLVALKSATYAGIKVPDEVFDRVSRYLDLVAEEVSQGFPVIEVNGQGIKAEKGALYSYQVGTSFKPTNVMTAEGILMRQYLGWDQHDPRIVQAADILLSGFLPTWEERDVYYWYYATQMFSHLDGEPWKKWNAAMRDMVVEKQVKEGPQKGSWNPLGSGSNQAVGADFWCLNGAGGRHYVTCMSLYVLEVYYRHMPIYQIKGRDKTAR